MDETLISPEAELADAASIASIEAEVAAATKRLTEANKVNESSSDDDLMIAISSIKSTLEALSASIKKEDEDVERYTQYLKGRKVYDELRHIRWKERMVEQTADQPAGTPATFDEPSLNLIIARGYLKSDREKKSGRRKKKVWLTPEQEMEIRKRRDAKNTVRMARIRHVRLLRDTASSPQSERDRLHFGPRWQEMIEWVNMLEEEAKFFENAYVWRERNKWYSTRINCNISIQENKNTGKCRAVVRGREDNSSTKICFYLNTYKAASVHSIETETKAMECLKSKVTEEQFARYFVSGTLVERSKKSGLTYIFRRMRPTLVYRDGVTPDGYIVPMFVAALCAHPQGYYGASWVGTLPPTDDVIAHLLMMRGDEKKFWRVSTQHNRFSPQADI